LGNNVSTAKLNIACQLMAETIKQDMTGNIAQISR
jgi:hypothetical protein